MLAMGIEIPKNNYFSDKRRRYSVFHSENLVQAVFRMHRRVRVYISKQMNLVIECLKNVNHMV